MNTGELARYLAHKTTHDSQSSSENNVREQRGTEDGYDLRLLTVAEAARTLRVSRWMLYQLIRSRHLETVQIGRRRLVPVAAIDDLIKNLRSEGTT